MEKQIVIEFSASALVDLGALNAALYTIWTAPDGQWIADSVSIKGLQRLESDRPPLEL